jgi:hypothetical protein
MQLSMQKAEQTALYRFKGRRFIHSYANKAAFTSSAIWLCSKLNPCRADLQTVYIAGVK